MRRGRAAGCSYVLAVSLVLDSKGRCRRRRLPRPACHSVNSDLRVCAALPAAGRQLFCFTGSELTLMPTIGSPRFSLTRAMISGLLVVGRRLDDGLGALAGSPLLKMPEPTKTPSTPICIISAASAGVAMPPAAKLTTGRRPSSFDFDDQVVRRADFLGVGHQLFVRHQLQAANLAQHGARVADCFDDVAGSRFALGPNHGCALADAAQGLAQIAAAADKGHLEIVLVDVVSLIRRRQNLALVDVVDADRLAGSALPRNVRCGTWPSPGWRRRP